MIENITSWAILAFSLLAAWHFFWESIIAPARRHEEQLRLFRIRDSVREEMWKVRNENEIVAQFATQQSIANNAIKLLHRLELWSYVEFRIRQELDEEFRKEVSSAENRFRFSADQRSVKAIDEMSRVLRRALAVNFGGWLIFIVPVIFLVVFWSKLRRNCRSILSTTRDDNKRHSSGSGHGYAVAPC